MKKLFAFVLCTFFMVMFIAPSLLTDSGKANAIIDVKGKMWYEDNNLRVAAGYPSDMVYKFSTAPESWQYARDNMSVYMIRSNTIRKHPEVFTDDFLQTMVNVLKQSDVAWAIDSTSSTWLNYNYHIKIEDCQTEMDLIKKIQKMGGTVSHVLLQSVLSKPKRDSNRNIVDYPMENRIKDCRDYADLMAQNGLWGTVKLGIIDALPTKNKPYQSPYSDVKNALTADGYDLHTVLLDVPCEFPTQQLNGMSWNKVKEVENYVKNTLDCEFILSCVSRDGGMTSARLYHNTVLGILDQYEPVGGNPDGFCLMAWFPHPKFSVPETAPDADPSVPDSQCEENYPMHKTQKMFAEKLLNYNPIPVPTPTPAPVFYDSFENGFGQWGVNFGTPTLSSVAYHGTSSYFPNEDRDEIYHNMGAQYSNVVTVMFYDDITQNDMKVKAKLNDGSNITMLGVNTNISTSKYCYSTGGGFIASAVDRTTGWHEFKFDLSSGSDCKMYIDGVLVAATSNMTSYKRIILGDNAADGKMGNVYFDYVLVE